MTRAAPLSPIPLVVLIWLAGLGAAAQYGKVAVVFAQLPQIYPDVEAGLGFALSLVGLVGMVFGVVAGVFVARLGYRRTMIWGLWAGAVISLFQATVPAFELFLVSRVIEGMSHLVIVVAAPTLIALLSTARTRGATLTLWGTFFGVAFTILVWVGVPFAMRFGVPALFLAHGVYMAVFAVILMRVLPHTEATEVSAPVSIGWVVRRHGDIYRSPFVSAPALAWIFYTLSYVSLLTLLPPYIDASLRVLIVGAMPLVSIAASLTLGVWLLRRVSAIRVIELGFLGSVLSALALVVVQGDPILCLCLATCLGLVQGAGFVAVPELNEALADRALANGGLAQTGNIGNTLGPPLLLAMIGVGGYPAMMLAAAGILGAGIVVQMWLTRRRSGFR